MPPHYSLAGMNAIHFQIPVLTHGIEGIGMPFSPKQILFAKSVIFYLIQPINIYMYVYMYMDMYIYVCTCLNYSHNLLIFRVNESMTKTHIKIG